MILKFNMIVVMKLVSSRGMRYLFVIGVERLVGFLKFTSNKLCYKIYI